MSRATQQPGVSVLLTSREDGQLAECRTQFPASGPERTRCGTDLTERADPQEPARCQALDQRPIKPGIAELVAQQHLDRGPRRQTLVEIDDTETALLFKSRTPGQISSLRHGHR